MTCFPISLCNIHVKNDRIPQDSMLNSRHCNLFTVLIGTRTVTLLPLSICIVHLKDDCIPQ